MSFADRRFHLIGIGGAGMSALATVAYAWGAEVSGCDRSTSPYGERLQRFGIPVAAGHDPSHLEDDMEVVVSTAIEADEPELLAARDRGLRRLHRAQLLAEMVASRRSICVAGAHGKTTTAAMIAYAARQGGLDPTFLIGGDVPQLGGNAGPGGGSLLVAEGDESDGSLALLRPRVAVVLNVELDHHARFASQAELMELFRAWVADVPASGAVILHESVDLESDALVQRFGGGDVDWQVSGIEPGPDGTGFWLRTPDGTPLHIVLSVPGAHNAGNAAAAIAALSAGMGVEPADAAAALQGFRGAGRRFEPRGEVGGARIVDDYAHHPTEVEATIAAARAQGAGRVVVCFQPHLYSRTAALAGRFGRALA
jgi:UDP-N-acetylmuramate--alanine ligase